MYWSIARKGSRKEIVSVDEYESSFVRGEVIGIFKFLQYASFSTRAKSHWLSNAYYWLQDRMCTCRLSQANSIP